MGRDCNDREKKMSQVTCKDREERMLAFYDVSVQNVNHYEPRLKTP